MQGEEYFRSRVKKQEILSLASQLINLYTNICMYLMCSSIALNYICVNYKYVWQCMPILILLENGDYGIVRVCLGKWQMYETERRCLWGQDQRHVHLPACMSVYLPVCLCVCMSVYLYVCLSDVCLSVCPFVCMSECLCVCMSVYLLCL